MHLLGTLMRVQAKVWFLVNAVKQKRLQRRCSQMSSSTIPVLLLPHHVCIFKIWIYPFFFFFHSNQRRYLKRGHTFSSLPTQFSDLAESIVLVVSHRSSYITKGTSPSINSSSTSSLLKVFRHLLIRFFEKQIFFVCVMVNVNLFYDL